MSNKKSINAGAGSEDQLALKKKKLRHCRDHTFFIRTLLKNIRACTLCAAHLPAGPRPILTATPESRIMIIGQAPGRRVHESGIPWDDKSGDNLRAWLQVDSDTFYDPSRFALIPMGFCYPGTGKSGDLPPRPECAPLWHPPLMAALSRARLILLVGDFAQRYYLKEFRLGTLTETVREFRQFLPRFFPLPHPSPRNNIWQKKNPWFARSVLTALRKQVVSALSEIP